MKITNYTLIWILVIFTVYFLYEYFSFSTKLVICSTIYKECSTFAKFKNMNDCQETKEREEWYCNSIDPKNITCEYKKSDISTSYCSK